METMRRWTTALVVGVAIAFVLMAGEGAAASVAPATHANLQKAPTVGSWAVWRGGTGMPSSATSSSVKRLCKMQEDGPGGIYPISAKFAYVENWDNGDLVVCGSHTATKIATPPSGYSTKAYYGLGAITVSGELDLILLSFVVPGGYYCLGASVSGCTSTVAFKLPSSFCSSEPARYCNPDGVVLSTNLDFTYVDYPNGQMVTCTTYAASCSVDHTSFVFSGYHPVGIAKLGSKYVVSDESCSGLVWEGSTFNMSVVASLGDDLQGIAFHAKTLYVADDGYCADVPAHIIDVATGASLPTPLTAPENIGGLDSDLQFGSWETGVVYSV